MDVRALVLGGGGVAGIAWLTGLAAGFSRAGVDVSSADLILGTSAGATVAAQLASTTGVDHWYRRQVDPALQNPEFRPPGLSVAELWESLLRIAEEVDDPVERRRRVGALALAADTVAEPVRREVVAGRLPEGGWPSRRIGVVAVDAFTGQRRVFESGGPVDLVDAVAASSAVPGMWPPVTIGETRYIDGGIDSSVNADLAVGFPLVLILAPMPDPGLALQVEAIGSEGHAMVVSPDRASQAAFGADPLDPAVREPAARAGYAQGSALAGDVGRFWDSPVAGSTPPPVGP
jgi:NTE family protein